MAQSIHPVNKNCYLLSGDFTNGTEHSKWTEMKKKMDINFQTYKNLSKNNMNYKNVLSNNECTNI